MQSRSHSGHASSDTLTRATTTIAPATMRATTLLVRDFDPAEYFEGDDDVLNAIISGLEAESTTTATPATTRATTTLTSTTTTTTTTQATTTVSSTTTTTTTERTTTVSPTTTAEATTSIPATTTEVPATTPTTTTEATTTVTTTAEAITTPASTTEVITTAATTTAAPTTATTTPATTTTTRRPSTVSAKTLKKKKAGDASESRGVEVAPHVFARGMQNLGNTCWFNSVWQLLAHADLFLAYMESLAVPVEDSPLSSAVAASKELVRLHWSDDSARIDPEEVFNSFTRFSALFTVGQTRDAHDGLVEIRDVLSRAGRSGLFDFELETTIICRRSRQMTSRRDAAEELQISVPESTSTLQLAALIRQYFTRELVREYVCPDGEVGGYRQFKMKSAPRLLVVQLKRYRTSVRDGNMITHKITTAIDTPLQLDLADLPGHPADARYSLQGIVSHHGSFGGGHYVADFVHPSNGRWMSTSDSRVTSHEAPQADPKASYLLLFQRTDV